MRLRREAHWVQAPPAPQCGQTDADDWLERQRERLLLPVSYFLVTFTVPEELRRLIRSHSQIGLDLLFAASSRALQDLAGNPKRLGAQLGLLGVLHTWSRTLIFHPHIHYLVPAGGLSPDGRTWIPAKNNFLVHVKALGAHFRTLYKELLQKQHPGLFAEVPAKVWKHGWVVHSQPAGSGENALRYLSLYIFKTATSNRVVQLLPNGKVRWSYRESQSGQARSMELDPMDFMARFLQHTLPCGFARVRTFGWFHPAAKIRRNRVRALLGENPLLTPREQQTWNPPSQPEPEIETEAVIAPSRAPACPICHKTMNFVGKWSRGHPPPVLHPNRPP
jgi:hypothetical protein